MRAGPPSSPIRFVSVGPLHRPDRPPFPSPLPIAETTHTVNPGPTRSARTLGWVGGVPLLGSRAPEPPSVNAVGTPFVRDGPGPGIPTVNTVGTPFESEMDRFPKVLEISHRVRTGVVFPSGSPVQTGTDGPTWGPRHRVSTLRRR